jgi:pSer/pThr/pTyr-binding forkhead associated (FHA) protein
MVGPAVHLEVVAGNATGMSILVEDELVIGRHAEGAGRLAEDEEISRAHARLSMDSRGLCALEDLGSTNGTFLNGIRITAPQTLSEGDTIELGATTLVVRELPRVSEEPAAAIGSARTQTTVAPVGALPGAAVPTPAAEPAATEPIAETEIPLAAAAPDVPATLSLQLDIDFGTGELQLRVDDTSEPLRLVYDGDSWRPASPAIEKGNPHEHRADDA